MPAESTEALHARVTRLEIDGQDSRQESRETRSEIKALTGSVSDLARSVAVLAQQVSDLAAQVSGLVHEKHRILADMPAPPGMMGVGKVAAACSAGVAAMAEAVRYLASLAH